MTTRIDDTLDREERRLPCGLTVGVQTYRPGVYMSPHSHGYSNVTVHLSGRVVEASGPREHLATSMSVVVKPAGTVHSNAFGPGGARTLRVKIDEPWLDRYPRETRAADRYRWFHEGPVSRIGVQLLKEFVSPDDAAEIALESLFLELLGEIDREATEAVRGPAWLDDLERKLRDGFLERMQVSRLADDIGIHPVYLARTFRRRHGCTVGEFVRRLRLAWCTRTLAETDMPLPSVALAAGFSDQSHFSRLFRDHTGLPPGRFRSLVRL